MLIRTGTAGNGVQNFNDSSHSGHKTTQMCIGEVDSDQVIRNVQMLVQRHEEICHS